MKTNHLAMAGLLLALSGVAGAQDANVGPMELNHYPYPLDVRSVTGLQQLQDKLQLQPQQQAAWQQLLTSVAADNDGIANTVSAGAAKQALEAQLSPAQRQLLEQFRQELLWDLN